MYSRSTLALKYLRYYLQASNGRGHGTHSPFVYHFIKKILNDQQHYPGYEKVETLRRFLLGNRTLINVTDYGAGSALGGSNTRSIASLARNAAKPAKFGQLLYRMVRHYQPKHILELGTSLGLTTAYFSLANPDAHITTLEGAEEVSQIASANFKQLQLQNIVQVNGNFDNALPSVLDSMRTIDFAFIDGNHRKEPTLDYFLQLLPKVNNNSILIFDDIHWSRGMEEAWTAIKGHKDVRYSIDLFFIGILFFRQEFREKQDFVIRF